MMERQLRQMVRLVDDLLDVSRITTGKLALRTEPRRPARRARERGRDGAAVHRGARPRRSTLDAARAAAAARRRPDAARAGVLEPAQQRRASTPSPAGRIRSTSRVRGRLTSSRASTTTASASTPAMLDEGLRAVRAGRPLARAHATRVSASASRSRAGWSSCTAARIEAASEGPGQGQHVHRAPAAARRAEARAPTRRGRTRVAASTARPPHPGRRRQPRLRVEPRDAADRAGPRGARRQRRRAGGSRPRASFTPDVAFLDIGMPKINGYELAEELRAEPALGRTRLVALTGWGQDQRPPAGARRRLRPAPGQAGQARRHRRHPHGAAGRALAGADRRCRARGVPLADGNRVPGARQAHPPHVASGGGRVGCAADPLGPRRSEGARPDRRQHGEPQPAQRHRHAQRLVRRLSRARGRGGRADARPQARPHQHDADRSDRAVSGVGRSRQDRVDRSVRRHRRRRLSRRDRAGLRHPPDDRGDQGAHRHARGASRDRGGPARRPTAASCSRTAPRW